MKKNVDKSTYYHYRQHNTMNQSIQFANSFTLRL